MKTSSHKNEAARLLGSICSPAKAVAAQRNGQKGGRPRTRPSVSIRLRGFPTSVLKAIASIEAQGAPAVGGKLATQPQLISFLVDQALCMSMPRLLKEWNIK